MSRLWQAAGVALILLFAMAIAGAVFDLGDPARGALRVRAAEIAPPAIATPAPEALAAQGSPASGAPPASPALPAEGDPAFVQASAPLHAPAAMPAQLPTPLPPALLPQPTLFPQPTPPAPGVGTVTLPLANPAGQAQLAVSYALDTAHVRAGPSVASQILTTLAPDTPLAVIAISADGQWYQLADGGWISVYLVGNSPTGLPVVGQQASVVAGAPVASVPVVSVPVVSILVPGPGSPMDPPTATPLPPIVQAPVRLPQPAPLLSGSRVAIYLAGDVRTIALRNDSAWPVDLDGWRLVLGAGSPNCALAGIVQPGVSLPVSGASATLGATCVLGAPVGQGSEPDVTILIDATGQIILRCK